MVFLLALVLRLVVVLLTRQLGIGLDDMFQYDMLARSLAAGNGFRWYAPADAAYLAPYLNVDLKSLGLDPRGLLTTFRAPLYPGLLALVYFTFGSGEGRFLAARLTQAGLGAALAPMTYLAAKRILSSSDWAPSSAERAARTSAILVSAYPMLVIFPLALATENLLFPLVLAAVLALLELSRRTSPSRIDEVPGMRASGLALVAGFLLGLCVLTRSVVLPAACAALLWAWFVLKRLRLAMLAAAALACTIVPWVIRNSIVSGRLTGVETSMGYNLYLGYHPSSTGTFAFGPSLDLLSILDDQEREQVAIERAQEFMRADPGRLPYLALRRLGHFFDFEWRAFTYFYSNGFLGQLAPGSVVMALGLLSLPFALLASSAVFGAAALRRKPESTLLLLLLGAYLIPHVLILSEERFHLVLVPFLAILAAAAWAGSRPNRSMGENHAAWSKWLAFLLLLNWGAQVGRSWLTLARLIGEGGSSLHLPY
jgi:hypothetical protein